MTISILGGEAKGAKIKTPRGAQTRPTSVLLKRKFFDAYQNFDGMRFFDLCSGSGSIGLEGLSRGALSCAFVETHHESLKVCKENYLHLKSVYSLEGSASFFKQDAEKWLENNVELLKGASDLKSVLFFDPPYESKGMYIKFFSILQKLKGSWLTVVVEFCRQKTMAEEDFLKLFDPPQKVYRQGTSFLYIYELR